MASPPRITTIPKWRRIKSTALMIIFLSSLMGLIYPLFNDGFESIYHFINGFTVGFLGGILISFIELYVFYPPLRRFGFFSTVVAKVIVYCISFTVLILGVILISHSIQYGKSPVAVYYSEDFQKFLFNEGVTGHFNECPGISISSHFYKRNKSQNRGGNALKFHNG